MADRGITPTVRPTPAPRAMDLRERLRAATDQLASLGSVDRQALRAAIDPRRAPAWLVGVILVAVPSHALAVWRVFGDLPPGTRPPLQDSLIFEYIGWFLTRGGRLYLDIWELKPPLPFEVAALVSLLAGGDPVVSHWFHVGLTAGAAVATAVVVAALVADVTDDAVAAFAAGASLYVLPAFHWRAAYGFKAKYFVPLFVLLAVYLARRDRPGAAGVAAGAATGFWQLAVVAPVLAAGITYDRGGREAVRRLVAGLAAVLVVALLPVVYWGALEAMVTETLLTPMLVGEDLAPSQQFWLAVFLFGASLPVAALGVVGVGVAARRRPRSTWWLAAGTAWFALQVLVIDLDGHPDLFPVMAFLAVGLGLLLGLEGGPQRPAAALIAAMAVLSVITMGGMGFAQSTLPQPEPTAYEPDRLLETPYAPEDRPHLYWNRVPVEDCRAFFGGTQRRLVELTGQRGVQATCGDPSPVVDALFDRWFGW